MSAAQKGTKKHGGVAVTDISSFVLPALTMACVALSLDDASAWFQGDEDDTPRNSCREAALKLIMTLFLYRRPKAEVAVQNAERVRLGDPKKVRLVAKLLEHRHNRMEQMTTMLSAGTCMSSVRV